MNLRFIKKKFFERDRGIWNKEEKREVRKRNLLKHVMWIMHLEFFGRREYKKKYGKMMMLQKGKR